MRKVYIHFVVTERGSLDFDEITDDKGKPFIPNDLHSLWDFMDDDFRLGPFLIAGDDDVLATHKVPNCGGD